MKYLAILVFLFSSSLFSSLVYSETASERATMYFTDIKSEEFAKAASHFDSAQLKEFRDSMSFYKSLPDEVKSEFIQTFYGPDETLESIDKLNDAEFFAAVFGFIMRQAQGLGGLDMGNLEVLGEVKEGDDIIHVLTRNKVTVGEISSESMEVISMKQQDDEWRVLMSGEIKGLSQQLEKAFSVPEQ